MKVQLPILYLDIDGVLNVPHDGEPLRFGREPCRQLNRIIQATGCLTVISSSWRYLILSKNRSMTESGFRTLLLTHGVRLGRDPEVTESDEDEPEREDQIMNHVMLKNIDHDVSFTVLDDDPMDFGKKDSHFIKTEFSTGLTSEDASRAIERLQTVKYSRGHFRTLQGNWRA